MKITLFGGECGIPARSVAWGSCWLLCGWTLEANPQGLTVGSGSASVSGPGPVLTVTVSDHALLNWQSFNIAPGEKTIFNQPSSTSIVWNQILDSNPSKIFGSLQANGIVVLANQQGFWFGPNSVVKTAGFIATTASGPGAGFFNGGPWSLEIPPPAASIINYGQISVASGGSLFLVAEKIENYGVLSAPDGTLGLYAGKEVLVSQSPDGRGLSAKVVLPEGSIDNFGRLIADAGTIALHAQVVNQDGIVQADSIREVNGVIEFYASNEISLGPQSVTDAQGTGLSASSGGKVTIQSGGTFTDVPSATINVSGGPKGGNGGQLEISSVNVPQIQAQLKATAANGYSRGLLTIDPQTINIDDSASGTIASGSVNAGDKPNTLTLPTSAFANFSVIDLQATKQINIKSLWNLPDVPAGGASLTLESGGDITFAQSAGIVGGIGWNVSLLAGSKFDGLGGVTQGIGSIKGSDTSVSSYSLSTVGGSLSLTAGKDIAVLSSQVSSTSGNISVVSTGGSFSGNSFNIGPTSGNISIQAANNVSLSTGKVAAQSKGTVQIVANTGNITATSATVSSEQGDINLLAEGNISFSKTQQGAVRTTSGGNLTAVATTGSITTGGNNNGYIIQGANQPLSVSPNLGGFSTVAGGNVSLTAGKDITAYLPVSQDLKSSRIDAGSGAFGFGLDANGNPIGGNVTVVAGGSVYGHFVIADGSGSINAGAYAGVSQTQLALTTRTGSWSVSATDISLQEVRNTQGVFNNVGGSDKKNSYFHLFDYSTGVGSIPVTTVTLNAVDSIDLVGANLPRYNSDLPSIYPPVLKMTAGAGGIILGNPIDQSTTDVILFPSPKGDISIHSDQGGIRGFGAAGASLTLSDSGSSRWTDSTSFTSSDHKSDSPVHFGDLTTSEINVGGSLDNLLLYFGKATAITVGGDLNLTSVAWQNNNPSDTSKLIVAGDIKNRSQYTFEKLLPGEADPDLTLLDQSCAVIDVHLNYDPTTRTVVLLGQLTPDQANLLNNFSINGINSAGEPICVPTTLLSSRVVNALLNDSSDITQIPQNGYQVAGPGKLVVQARSIDLGVSSGILSIGAYGNPALAKTSLTGADLSVSTTTGDISLFSSAIVSQAGGSVTINSGGRVIAGANYVEPGSDTARGIYTSGGGAVTVNAVGDIDVNGSRIGTYDGGTVTVTSSTGSIDAGSGGLTYQKVTQVTVDPVTRNVITSTDFIPGSGILAATFSTGNAQVGDINVTAPQGNITAHTGGIVQAPFNGTSGKDAQVNVSAGSPGYIRNVEANGSGIIGGNVNVTATGNIEGVIIASGSATITTPQGNVGVTVIAQGPVNVSAGTLTGTLISFSSINVDAGSVGAALIANSVSTGTAQNTGQTGFASTATATATATAASADSGKKADNTKLVASTDDDDTNKKKSKPLIAQTRPRVTVLLPGKLN